MRHARRLAEIFRTGAWLTEDRAFACAVILLAFEIVTAAFLTAGTYGLIVPLDNPTTTDFVSFYAAGMLADDGSANLAYTQPEHFAAEQRATQPGIAYVFFYYPPVFILLCALFATLPYLVAFAAFEGATVLAYLATADRILGRPGLRWLVPALAYPAVFVNIGVGQNGLLTSTLFGAATLLIDERPLVSGVLFGAVCYKPHFGLLIPVALIAGSRWRAVAAAALTVIALVGLSTAVFGWETWQGFLDAIGGSSRATYEGGKVDYAAFANVFGALRLSGASPAAAYLAQGATTVAAAGLVAYVWRRGLPLAVRAATLTAATVAAAPLSLFYDLVLAGIAMAWLIRHGREHGFVPWEKTTLALVFIAPLLSRGFGASWHVPLAAAGVFALVFVCAAVCRETLREAK